MSKEQEIRDAILAGILPEDLEQRDLHLATDFDTEIIEAVLNVVFKCTLIKALKEGVEDFNEPATMTSLLVTALAALTIRCGKLEIFNDESINEMGDHIKDKFVEMVKVNLEWVKLQRSRHEKETDPETPDS